MGSPNRLVWSFLLVLFMFTLVMLYIGERFSAVRLVGEIQRLHQMRTDLERQNARLRIEQDELSSPRRIEQVASNMLAMRYPDDGQMVYLWTSDPREMRVALLPSTEE
ncbi:hypothetical protein AMJ39_04470 [candidate division TA06 bacterium DG_24]|jgi:cell division protein FtsL|uniref:Cell division protein FtsL n=2 Tax=Bacteria division TA06 TaxID=1156500 RepID=A0A0S8GAN5_UNCT6|nr:MAG: hypothetical protein AMJ39_04470 [candidate division TA06 bacterium DG_24]KPK68893.1 MAG: hypothetical protein AMJ82_07075 [candidate division TA06 bacterium SM23_40]